MSRSFRSARTPGSGLIEDECRKANVTPPQIGIDAGSSVAACLMVSEGAGIALVDHATALSGRFTNLAFRSFEADSESEGATHLSARAAAIPRGGATIGSSASQRLEARALSLSASLFENVLCHRQRREDVGPAVSAESERWCRCGPTMLRSETRFGDAPWPDFGRRQCGSMTLACLLCRQRCSYRLVNALPRCARNLSTVVCAVWIRTIERACPFQKTARHVLQSFGRCTGWPTAHGRVVPLGRPMTASAGVGI